MKVHEMAQNASGAALPYLGIQILKLEAGQELNQHRDYHNHPDYPNHTMKFGKYSGGSLQMLRYGRWHSYDVENQWLSFDALKSKPSPELQKEPKRISPSSFIFTNTFLRDFAPEQPF